MFKPRDAMSYVYLVTGKDQEKIAELNNKEEIRDHLKHRSSNSVSLNPYRPIEDQVKVKIRPKDELILKPKS